MERAFPASRCSMARSARRLPNSQENGEWPGGAGPLEPFCRRAFAGKECLHAAKARSADALASASYRSPAVRLGIITKATRRTTFRTSLTGYNAERTKRSRFGGWANRNRYLTMANQDQDSRRSARNPICSKWWSCASARSSSCARMAAYDAQSVRAQALSAYDL